MALPTRLIALASLLTVISLPSSCRYQNFTTEVLIPFVPDSVNSALPFTGYNRVAITVGSGNASLNLTPIVDTGTCGYVISSDRVPGWPPVNLSDYPIGWEFLSSSKKLYSGHWIPQDILFRGADVEVKAHFPLLVVEDTVICFNYNETTDTNVCPTPTTGTAPVITHLPTGISLFGVGFGRQFDGQPQGNPDKNPFLNIVSIDGVPIASGDDFLNGYLITQEGITIGLTEPNTAGMDFVELNVGLNHDAYPLDWAPVPACIAVDDMSCIHGTALFDTGLFQSYLTLPLGSPVKVHTGHSASTGAEVSVLDDGSYVQLSFGSGEGLTQDDFYVVNSTTTNITDQTPNMVITTLADPAIRAPFVNTGAHFFRCWNTAFDPVGGRFGFRKIEATVREL